MKEVASQIVGHWTLRQLQVKYDINAVGQREIKLIKDSTYLNLATLTITPALVPRTLPIDLRRGEYDGTITYGGKSYPIMFNMIANYEWLATKKGPQTFFYLEYHFPDGSHLTEPEEAFLEKIGLVGNNYSLETITGPTMIWQGLKKGVGRIEMVKQ